MNLESRAHSILIGEKKVPFPIHFSFPTFHCRHTKFMQNGNGLGIEICPQDVYQRLTILVVNTGLYTKRLKRQGGGRYCLSHS